MRLVALLDRFVPAEAVGDVRRVAATRVFVAICLASAVIEPIMSLRHFLHAHNPIAGGLTLAVTCLAAGLLVAIRRGLAIHVVMDLTATFVVVLSSLVSLSRGGFFVSTLIGSAIVPTFIGLFGRRRATIVWALVVAADFAVLAAVTASGTHGLLPGTAVDAAPLFGFLVMTTVIALFHERSQRAHEEEKTALQHRVALAERLESLGQLAAGVAHDFNNLLTVFRAAGEVMVEELPPHHPLRGDAEAVRDAADRGSKIARQLLAFARAPTAAEERFEIGATLRELEPLLRRALPERITLGLALPDRRIGVAGDAQALLHVVLNLVVNARDAMPSGGTITVAASELAGERVAIDVTDEGSGIPSDVLPRIFDPFFTTKARGQGSGLGLASAYGIVRAMRGEIRVARTELGRGTTFRVTLPIAPAALVSVRPPAAASERPRALGRPVVLVVDDQPELGTATRRLLGQRFETLVASEPAKALALARARAELAAVVTGVCMPEMGGVELAAELRRIRPGIAVVYMTGYSDDEAIERELQSGAARMVRKPFDRATLVAAIESALGGSAAA